MSKIVVKDDLIRLCKIAFVYTVLLSGVEFLYGVKWGVLWWCKVIIVSNPTAVKLELSCIEVVVGVLTIVCFQYKLWAK